MTAWSGRFSGCLVDDFSWPWSDGTARDAVSRARGPCPRAAFYYLISPYLSIFPSLHLSISLSFSFLSFSFFS